MTESYIALGGIIAVVLTGTVALYRSIRRDRFNNYSRSRSAFYSFIGFVVAFMILNGMAYSIGHQKEWVTYDLTALSVDSSVSGSFFLGSGTIDEEAVFYFYTRDENNRVHLAHTLADGADLIETSGKPYARCYTTFSKYFENRQDEGTPSSDYDFVTCDFYVPAGSIKSDFNTTLPGGN